MTHDANGVPYAVGQRVRFTGVVEHVEELGGCIRVLGDRQPSGYVIVAMVPARCMEIVDAALGPERQPGGETSTATPAPRKEGSP